MDLASFFAETAEAVEPKQAGPVPVFPVPATPSGNGQTIQDNGISRTSRISRSPDVPLGLAGAETVQAGAGGRAGERARVSDVGCREIREQREKLAGSYTYISRSSFQKREMEGKSGNLSLLPVKDGLALWRAGLARLVPIDPERPSGVAGYRLGEWPRVYERAVAFLDQFGAQAEALGWTASRLFGVHREVGIVRVDCSGALELPIGGTVRAITATEVSFGHLTHREKPGQVKGSPIWEVAL